MWFTEPGNLKDKKLKSKNLQVLNFAYCIFGMKDGRKWLIFKVNETKDRICQLQDRLKDVSMVREREEVRSKEKGKGRARETDERERKKE